MAQQQIVKSGNLFTDDSLASLTRSSLCFDSTPATITVEAAYSKHRRKDILPLFPELAEKLESYLNPTDSGHDSGDVISFENAKAIPSQLIWPSNWSTHRRGAKILRRDLKAAKIPYQDERGRCFDFHALRHHFISSLGRAGVPLTSAQALARHSDPKLTANIYTHLELDNLSVAVSALPSLPKPKNQKALKTS